MSTTAPTVGTKPLAWSYSALKNSETCLRRYQAYSITKEVVEPESAEIKRGHEVHAAFKSRVADNVPLPVGMGVFEPMLARLAEAPGKIYAEQQLALTPEFKPSAWFGKNTWFRIVVDYAVLRDDATATAIDYKTGKPATDDTQLALTAATLFAHHPTLKRIKAALLFVSYGEVERREYHREDTTSIWADVLPRVLKLFQARQTNEYPPNPGRLCRNWCAVRSCPFNGR